MMSHSDDNFSFLNWIVFMLLIYTIAIGIMFDGIDNMNFIMVGVIIALLLGQITIFIKTKKPHREYAPIIYNIHTRDAEGQERYKKDDMQYEKKNQKSLFAYYGTFLIPMVLTVLSLYSVFDFTIGISFFISAVVSTICMVILIKVFNLEQHKSL